MPIRLPCMYNKDMISVIVCSNRDPSDTLHERNTRKTASAGAVDYIRIDNRATGRGICAAYNLGVASARATSLSSCTTTPSFSNTDGTRR